jgi:hypothetical protein
VVLDMDVLARQAVNRHFQVRAVIAASATT